jgi:hypothetical protein
MRTSILLKCSAASIALSLGLASSSFAQTQTSGTQPTGGNTRTEIKPASFTRAFVVDDRLSPLRREPNPQSEIIQRLRLGRPVLITRWSRRLGQPRYCRVAVTRRTRGWIHESALAIHSRAAEDQRIMKLIEAATESLDRIALCRLLIERFGHSKLVPRALLLTGEEAERSAKELSRRAKRRLSTTNVDNANAGARDYYLNDAGLDRYSKLRVVFDFNESEVEYVYDGQAYRDVVRRFPNGEEAKLARHRLQVAGKLTRRL